MSSSGEAQVIKIGTDPRRLLETEIADVIEDTRKAMESELRISNNTTSTHRVSHDKVLTEKSSVLDDNKVRGFRSTSLLGEKSCGSASKEKGFIPPADWANAPEFVPRFFGAPSCAPVSSASRSYASVVGHASFPETLGSTDSTDAELCPYFMVGECRFGETCCYLHGIMCEFCGMSCLHPFDPVQREKHSRECVEQHEKDMELSFAVARSSDKTCGICMEVIMEKTPSGEQRFGILPKCNHCFCLSCIRKWRQARQFENKIIRACPECRITSDYVCPSRYWVETKEDKDKLIRSYRESLSKKPCRYYASGAGNCQFGNKCFYLHALPDGQIVDVGPPKRRTRRQAANGETAESQPVSIWEFLEQWELQWFEIEDLMDMMDSDETSNWSGEEMGDFDDDFETYGWDNPDALE